MKQITNTFGRRVLSLYGQIKYRYLLPVYRLLGLLPQPAAQNERLRVSIDTRIPDTLIVGEGNALYIAGWCYHSSQRIKKLDIVIDGISQRVRAFRMVRPHVLAAHSCGLDPHGYSYRSGFWAIVALPRIDSAIQSNLFIQAVLASGEICLEKIAPITIEPTYKRHHEIQLRDSANTNGEPLIAICMATYNPPIGLFARQVQSIRDQTHPNWICIISDDNSTPDILEEIQSIVAQDRRFLIYPSPSRRGFYRNFERCMSLVPEEAQFVALSDQDDYWHSDKLDILLSQFDNTTTLVYSDMNIVDSEGHRQSDTFWTTRPNNYTNLASLIFCNTITGAASLFSARLLSRILPFPETTGESYHDHWIGCVALAMGRIKFVNRPLYDYVQHPGNFLGYSAPPKESFRNKLKSLVRMPIDFLMYAMHGTRRIRSDLKRWEVTYFSDLLRVKLLARILELRCGPYVTKAKRNTIRHIMQIDESFLAATWLAIRGLRNIGRISETLGAENYLLGAVSWKGFWTLKSRLKSGTS
jgi:glycosyltransferase involved in cell wall biosynthesis